MTIECPNCSSGDLRRHCGSPTCVWYICYCGASPTSKYIVFDTSGGMFLEPRNYERA